MRRFALNSLFLGSMLLVSQTGCLSLFAKKDDLSGADAAAGTSKPLPELRPSESAKVCFATAESLEKGGKEAEAIHMYERARSIDARQVPLATRRLATLYGQIGEFDRAKQEYERALEQSPNDCEILNDFGYFYYCRGLWDDAEKKLRQSVASNPKFGRAWINLGMTLGQKGQTKESLEAFQKAVSPGQAWCNLGFLLTTQGKRAEAHDAFRQALKLEPDLQRAAQALAKLDAGVNAPKRPIDRTPPRTATLPTPATPEAPPAPRINRSEPIIVPAPAPAAERSVTSEVSVPSIPVAPDWPTKLNE